MGLVFLDYCCRLEAGHRRRLEKSPIADIQELFRRRLPDPNGCVFAVTLAADADAGTGADGQQLPSEEERVATKSAPVRLQELVREAAAEAGYECRSFRRASDWLPAAAGLEVMDDECGSGSGLSYAGGRDGQSPMFVEVFCLGRAAAALAAGPRPPPGAPARLPWNEQILGLRQRVMWPDKPAAYSSIAGDADPAASQHYGIVLPAVAAGATGAARPAQLLAVLSVWLSGGPAAAGSVPLEAQFRKFCTDAAWQGQGLGSALLAEMQRSLRAQGVRRLHMNARVEQVRRAEKNPVFQAPP
eukprot:SAG22_NODE_5579_length_990_cov_1.766554_1_plen_300_part_01